MFKNHYSGIITLSLFTAFTSLFFPARHYFTNARNVYAVRIDYSVQRT